MTANFVSGQPSTADQNVVTSQTYDAWGRGLVTTDPDGITETTTYASNKTDVASVADPLGNTTSFTSYDAIGQLLSEQDPLSRTQSTTYDWFGNRVDETDYAGVVTHSVYDGVGRLTSSYANWTSGGSGTSGVNNVRTTFTYDQFGQVTRQVSDAGVSDATSDTAYDLLGNVTSETSYPNGTSNGRTTTTYYGAAGMVVGSAGPIVPTSGSSPNCPETSPTVKCNTITSVDMNGRASAVTDAYGKITLTWYDLAGKTVREVLNYVSGGASNGSQNVTTTTRYDAADRVISVTDALGNVTSTIYDALDRITKVTRPDSTWLSTVYRPSGQVDMVSRPTATVGAEVWTKHLYDAAGRQTKTIDHFDRSTTARLWFNSFESGADGWSKNSTGWFTGAASTSATSTTADGFTGARGLAIVTGTSNYVGAYLDLSGSTFKSGHAYRVRARVKAPSGTSLQSHFGVDASGGDYIPLTAITANGNWQVFDGTWTPTADRSSNVHLSIRRIGTTSLTITVDEVILWDASSSAVNPSGPDWNIPTETVYDAAGRTTASVVVPGDPATDQALVTLTTYTNMDQVASVRTAATPAYPATLGEMDLDLMTTYAYDALGNQTDVTDPMDNVTHLEYDRRGNVTGSTANYVSGGAVNADQNVKATFAYDDLNEMTASCAPKHVQAGCNPSTPSTTAWRYTFDALGHISTETPPANSTGTALSATTYGYDTATGGTRLWRTCDHPAGGSCANSTRYIDSEYDALSRITKVTHFTGVGGSGTEVLRTESTFDAASQQTGITYYEATVQKDALTFTYNSMGLQTVTSRGGSPVTTFIYNADGKPTSRTDHAISSTASTFIYDWRGQQLSATSPAYSGSTTFSWRFDMLIGARAWPTGTNAATFAYDRAKRVTTLTEQASGSNQAVFTQSYDRTGVVTSEGRTLSGVSGIAGSGIQTFTYDDLHRVSGSSISGGPTESYDYDANSNRVSWNDGAATTTYDYNESDELTAQHRSGVDRTYTYDAYGNMTSSAVASSGATSYTYDAQGRVKSIAPPSGGALTFTLDALGRHWTKSVGGSLVDTYGYLGASSAVVRIDQSSTSINSAIDAIGNRTATATTSGGLGWTLPTLHGDVAGNLSSSGGAVTDAFRYSAYGVTLAKTTSSLPSPWRYQGRLLLNTADGTGVNTDLYDFIVRAYDPALGVFTSLDTLAGSAQNPLSLNRFLYALANPTTMIDPSGHEGCGWFAVICDTAANLGNFALGAGEGLLDAGAALVTGTIDLGKAAVGAVVDTVGCMGNSTCRDQTFAAMGRAASEFVRDPAGSTRRIVNSVSNGWDALYDAAATGVQNTLDRASNAWNTGNFRELGRITGRVVGEVALTFVPVAGLVGKLGTVGRLVTEVAQASRWTRPLASVASSATSLGRTVTTTLSRATAAARTAVGTASSQIQRSVSHALGCFDSFTPHTLVATAAGAVAIASLAIGDHVLAFDEATGTTASYPVSAVHVNADPVTGTVVIAGETIETTPHHPFYVLGSGWVQAQDLEPGMRVPSESSDPGEVESVDFSAGPATMYNLTVEVAHTYFVGDGAWLVHNCPPARLLPGEGAAGTYGDLLRAGSKGDDLTPNHMPSSAYMRSKAPNYRHDDGIAFNMRQPAGRGGPHRATQTYGPRPNLNLSPRDSLARDVWDVRSIYRKEGLYTPTIRRGLQTVIRLNKTRYPALFMRRGLLE
ncbi:MAG: polymorphic toxin-type HINT domain-containing protein [Chloroflexota bacterium]